MQHSINMNTQSSMSEQSVGNTHDLALRGMNALVKTVKTIQFAYQIRKERQALATLSPEQLQDLGIHRVAAIRESERSILDLPSRHRQC